jgi:hypothetical protein
MKRVALSLVAVFLMSCRTPPPPPAPVSESVDALVQEFTYGTLAMSPTAATQAGYHEHNGASLDEALDDFSATGPNGLDAQRRFIDGIRRRIAGLNTAALDKEQQADLQIVKNNLGLQALELNTIQSYKHNPTVYVELAGNALYSPLVLNYAPLERRFQHIIKRLEKMPALFEQAKANLVDAPEVWNRVAREENEGNIDLIDHTLRQAVPDSQKAAYGPAADRAIAALKDFNAFLKDTLSSRTSDWRLGKEKYARKFEYVMAAGK